MSEQDGASNRSEDEDAGQVEFVDAGFYAWISVWKAQSVVTRALEAELREKTGLPLSACEVLSRIAAAPDGRLRMQELARRLILSKSGVTRLVTQLSELGLVRREGDPGNLRATYAVLTDEGRKAFPSTAPIFLEAVRRYFSRFLSESEIEVVTGAMNKVIMGMGHEPEDSLETDAAANLVRMVGGD